MAVEEKKAKEGAEAAPQKKGGTIKWIIIGAVVFLVLAGGGFVGWKKFSQPAPPKEAIKEDAAVKVDVGPIMNLDPFIVNLAGTGGERYLKVTLELELKDSLLIAEMEKRKPQVRDTLLLLLSSKTLDDIATFRGKTKLRNEITSRLNALLTPDSVKKVYFTEFVVQ
jgi:flagellar FliL protein